MQAAGGVAVQAEAAAACEVLLREASRREGERPPPRWQREGGGAAAVAAAKARSDAAAPLSQTLMWDFEEAAGGGAAMRRTLAALRAALPQEAPLVSDVCRLGYAALSLYPAHQPRSFLYPVGTTALGYGLPAAVGAALGRRLAGDSGPVAAILGDGGLQLSVQELAVAAEERLPLLLLVWNDGSYGEIKRSLPDFACTVPRPDLGLLAQAYGLHHLRVSSADEIEAALGSERVQRLLRGGGEAAGGPILLEVRRAWDANLQEAARKYKEDMKEHNRKMANRKWWQL